MHVDLGNDSLWLIPFFYKIAKEYNGKFMESCSFKYTSQLLIHRKLQRFYLVFLLSCCSDA